MYIQSHGYHSHIKSAQPIKFVNINRTSLNRAVWIGGQPGSNLGTPWGEGHVWISRGVSLCFKTGKVLRQLIFFIKNFSKLCIPKF